MQAQSSADKRTNVRLSQRALQMTFRSLAPMPTVASLLAARLWGTPPRAPVRLEQRQWLERAERLKVNAGGSTVAAYAWGDGPTVLLVHGWGGHAGQLTGFVEGLVGAGRRVVAFDAPSHGETRGGTPSIPGFAEVAHAIAAREGGVETVIAHSFGAAAMAFALSRGLETSRAVFLAPPATMSGAAERFAQMVALHPRALDQMRKRIEQRLSISWEQLEVMSNAHRMRSRLLVIHDEGDREVPLADGEAIAAAWPAATLITTAGLGHHRLVRDPEVVRRAVEFAVAPVPTTEKSG